MDQISDKILKGIQIDSLENEVRLFFENHQEDEGIQTITLANVYFMNIREVVNKKVDKIRVGQPGAYYTKALRNHSFSPENFQMINILFQDSEAELDILQMKKEANFLRN